jgi:hypothetical protein
MTETLFTQNVAKAKEFFATSKDMNKEVMKNDDFNMKKAEMFLVDGYTRDHSVDW